MDARTHQPRAPPGHPTSCTRSCRPQRWECQKPSLHPRRGSAVAGDAQGRKLQQTATRQERFYVGTEASFDSIIGYIVCWARRGNKAATPQSVHCIYAHVHLYHKDRCQQHKTQYVPTAYQNTPAGGQLSQKEQNALLPAEACDLQVSDWIQAQLCHCLQAQLGRVEMPPHSYPWACINLS